MKDVTGLEDLRVSNAMMDDVASRIDMPCTKDARIFLSHCMVVSAAFLSTCADQADGDGVEEIFDRVLCRLGIPTRLNT